MIMIYSDVTLTKKVDTLKTSLGKTEALIIGAGAGLSAAAGLLYNNADTFNALFPGYHDRYGLKTIDEADFYPFPPHTGRTIRLLGQVYRRHTL
jgi:hypothetical protein